METKKRTILSKEVAERKLRRMAYEILEENSGEKEIILAGIRDNGSLLAQMIRNMLSEISSFHTELIHLSLDKKMPGDVLLSNQLDFTNKVIIVIDDVSNSGKTLLYAIKPFLNFYPKKIQTLVLVERSYTAFPVRPDFVGLSVATTLEEHIVVEIAGNEVAGAYLY
jgi:pyrimidine operon attenuation protein/uracil phosphoribosyltransferase